jgi:hypothetical protein
MESDVPDPWWHQEFIPDKECGKANYISRDGKTLVEIQRNLAGTRGLHVGVLRMALSVARRPEMQRACLVLVGPRLSRDRLLREWKALTKLFTLNVMHRLSIVAIDPEGFWTEPEDEYLQQIARVLQADFPQMSHLGSQAGVKPVVGQKYFEVVKVLLSRWLRREGAIPIGKLAEQVGCSYPTVTQALKRLDRRRSIIRHSNRAVELGRFPQETWNELIALSSTMRQSFRYVDVSGEKPDPQHLLSRLERLKPPGVALSGVVAARFWHPDFDLHGTPRLDLVLHAPRRRVDLAFMRELDPALKLTENPSPSAVLVVHPLLRHDPWFTGEVGVRLPVADPVETVLDLYELGLTAQAGQLMTHLRPDLRLP